MNPISPYLNAAASNLYTVSKEIQPIVLPTVLAATKYGAAGAAGLVVLGTVACVSLGTVSIVFGFGATLLGNRSDGQKLVMEGSGCIQNILDNKGKLLKSTVGLTVLAVASHFAQSYMAGV